MCLLLVKRWLDQDDGLFQSRLVTTAPPQVARVPSFQLEVGAIVAPVPSTAHRKLTRELPRACRGHRQNRICRTPFTSLGWKMKERSLKILAQRSSCRSSEFRR